jgi:hypothetical protein
MGVSMEKKISVSGMLKEGLNIGFSNAGPLIVNILLWFLTFGFHI